MVFPKVWTQAGPIYIAMSFFEFSEKVAVVDKNLATLISQISHGIYPERKPRWSGVDQWRFSLSEKPSVTKYHFLEVLEKNLPCTSPDKCV